jgi:enoyl-CoA hydratase/carnithine racemase
MSYVGIVPLPTLDFTCNSCSPGNAMSAEPIICKKQAKVWTLMLNREDKANMLNIEMLQTLKAILATALQERKLRALILTGAGERVFCSGSEVDESTRQTQIQNVLWDEVGAALNSLPLLTIALVNGHCIGRAMTLLLGCDIRVSVPQARFSYPVLQNGALPGARDLDRLRALIGPGRSSALLLGGQRIHGERALNWGLVDYVVERPALANLGATLSLVATQSDGEHLATIKRLCRGS